MGLHCTADLQADFQYTGLGTEGETMASDSGDDSIDRTHVDSEPQAAAFKEPLGSLNLPTPITVPSDTPIVRAIEIMNQHGIGCVLVTAAGGLAGIFTERDVLRRVALLPLDLNTTPISKVMTANPVCLDSEDLVLSALNSMINGGYRHVPIVAGGKAIGVFGMRDCVRYVVEMYPDESLDEQLASFMFDI